MDTAADLDVFLADFGVDVIGPLGVAFRGILDQPDQIFDADMRIISTEYQLTFKTSAISQLKADDGMTIASIAYVVRQVLKDSDGAFSKALLSRVAS